MASVKVKFRPSAVGGQAGSVYYQIFHERKFRQLTTDYRVFPDEWDPVRGQVLARCAESSRREEVQAVRECVRRDVERLNRISSRLGRRGAEFGVDDVIEEFRNYKREYTLFKYMERLISGMRQADKVRTAETYRSALNSFRHYRKGEDIMLDCLDAEVIEGYEAWLKRRALIPNSISFYMRILRAVYNRAVTDEIIDNRNPFRKVYTGVDKTVKRALPLPVIRKIMRLELAKTPAVDYARDMFLMSFYLRGMSFIDMAFLRKSDLRNGSIIYRRRKTGKQLIIGWEPEMQKILDKYPENQTHYLLPIITRTMTNERNAYRNKGYNINRNLKQIARMVGISVPLTLYVARHSWASAAKVKGIPISVISEGMGHNSESTTQIYLSSLDTTVIDRANALILQSLK